MKIQYFTRGYSSMTTDQISSQKPLPMNSGLLLGMYVTRRGAFRVVGIITGPTAEKIACWTCLFPAFFLFRQKRLKLVGILHAALYEPIRNQPCAEIISPSS